MKVAEIFTSIIGEGRYMGRPAIFIRLAECNLRCEFCDSEFAWSSGIEMSSIDVIEKIRAINSKGIIENIVITGGEPLLQANELEKLFLLLSETGEYMIYLETNGTMFVENLDSYFEDITVSPKKRHVKEEVLKKYKEQYYDFKFVVGKRAWDLKEVEELVDRLGIDENCVWLMPETSGNKFDDDLCKEIWEFAVERGWNYSDRLHIRVFGNERGR